MALAQSADVGEVPGVRTGRRPAVHRRPPHRRTAARQLRIEPRVQVVTGSIPTVPGLVAESGRVALPQERLVQFLPLDFGVRALASPFELGPLVEAMWWHPVQDRDPEHAFLRDLVLRATRRVTDRSSA